MNLEINRKLCKDNWNIREFMNSISDEITARESYFEGGGWV